MDLAVRRVMAGGDAKEEDRRVDVGRAALWCAVPCAFVRFGKMGMESLSQSKGDFVTSLSPAGQPLGAAV